MKESILNVPNLRFPGFSGEWECCKLSTYLYENKERNRAGEFNKSDVLSVSGDCGVVNQIQLLGRSFAGKSVADYHIVRTGNIVYTKSPLKEYPYGIVKYNSGKDGIVSTLYAVYHHRENVNGRFVEHYFTSPQRTNRYFKPIVRIGAKHDMKIGNNEVLENTVLFPGLEEQNRITELLDLIDQRIAIQNKVIEDLKKLKTALCDRLYNESTPNCRIGDIIEQLSARNKDGNTQNVLSVSNRYGFISQAEQFEERSIASEDTTNYKVVRLNDFAYNPARINVGSIARLKSIEKGIVSPMYICFRCGEVVLPEFLEQFFSTKYFSLEVGKRLEGSVRMCLSFEGLCNIPISLPSLVQQKGISEKINCLNKKFQIEENYLFALLNQKQYLLSHLFI